MKLVDLIAQTFAHWFVESRGPDNQYGHPQWRCRCTACGATRLISGSALKRQPPGCACNRPARALNFKDLTGRTFGRWTVLAFAGISPTQQALWDCACSCPAMTRKQLTTTELHRSPHASCGCWKRELTIQRSVTHGMSKTPTYQAWAGMIKRCTNQRHKDYPYYGGRGITVEPRWARFESFLEDMGERPGAGYTLERQDNSLGYTPDNVVWATRQAQSRNKRDNKLITHNNQTKTVAEWAEELKIPTSRLYLRLWRGWDPIKALTEPFVPLSKRADIGRANKHGTPPYRPLT